MTEKRYIEESLPIREVSEKSVSERNKKQGYISNLHLWWSRKPLASSRATNYATLIKASKERIKNGGFGSLNWLVKKIVIFVVIKNYSRFRG